MAELDYARLKAIVQAGDLEHLVFQRVQEGEFLDYKRDAGGYLRSSKRYNPGRDEFLKDVTALANHRGGFLIIGIDEEKDSGAAVRLCGVQDIVDLRKKLQDWLCEPTLVTPPVRGHTITEILSPAGAAIVVGVPVRPHGYWHVVRDLGDKVHIREHRRVRTLTELEVTLHRDRDPATGFPFDFPAPIATLTSLVPNALTFSRPLLAFLAMAAVIAGMATAPFWLYIVALVTDVLDGMMARALHATTQSGKEYDRWCDILANGLAGLGIAIRSMEEGDHTVLAFIGLMLLVMAVMRIWMRAPSLVAKARSGLFRGVLIVLYWNRLPNGQGLAAGLTAVALAVIGGVYELGVMAHEHAARRRTWFGRRSR
jgi:phosphatidylglycerophosphate synthase